MIENMITHPWPYPKDWNYCHNLIRNFNGSETVLYNYSQSDQDIFVLGMLDGLKNGTYLELGAAWPNFNNNTALLAEKFNWTGISVEKNADFAPLWENIGRKFIVGNAIKLNYLEILSDMPNVIDYLSIDCDPSNVSFNVLKKIPFDHYNFRVITFEHDSYRYGDAVKMASRKYLESKGYKLVVSNISMNNKFNEDWIYEDWYAHPNYVDPKRLEDHMSIIDQAQLYSTYLYRQ